MTGFQVFITVLYVAATIAIVLILLLAIMTYFKVTSFLISSRELLRLAVMNNEDTRSKAASALETAQETKDATRQLTNKIDELKGVVTPPTQVEIKWEPGMQGRRKDDPPLHSTSIGLIFGPVIILLALSANIIASHTGQPQYTLDDTQMTKTQNHDGFYKACRLMRAGNHSAAIDAFTLAIDTGVNKEVCLARRAECQYYIGHLTEALEDADSIDRQYPNTPWASYIRGLVADKKGNVVQSREHFHTSMVLGHPYARYQLEGNRNAK